MANDKKEKNSEEKNLKEKLKAIDEKEESFYKSVKSLSLRLDRRQKKIQTTALLTKSKSEGSDQKAPRSESNQDDNSSPTIQQK